jgi:hypothetical protein
MYPLYLQGPDQARLGIRQGGTSSVSAWLRDRLEQAGPSGALGRLWAVEGQPRATNDDQRRLPAYRSPSRARTAVHVADSAHQFLRNKRAEWEDYRRQVTEYERRRYLPVL